MAGALLSLPQKVVVSAAAAGPPTTVAAAAAAAALAVANDAAPASAALPFFGAVHGVADVYSPRNPATEPADVCHDDAKGARRCGARR